MWDRHGIRLEWARDAWDDPNALVRDPDPSSRSGRSVRVLGYSRGARAVIVIIAVRHDDAVIAATAWLANGSHIRRYEEGNRHGPE